MQGSHFVEKTSQGDDLVDFAVLQNESAAFENRDLIEQHLVSS